MKLYATKLKDSDIKKAKCFLVHGDDYNQITQVCKIIKSTLNLPEKRVDLKEAKDLNFSDIFDAYSLFSQSELVTMSNFSAKLSKEILDRILLADYTNILLITSDNITTTSAFYKSASNSPDIIVIPCYFESGNISNIAEQIFSKHGIKYNKEVLNLLNDVVPSDNPYNTLETIATYFADSKQITIDELAEFSSVELNYSPDKLCVYFAMKDANKFFSELDKILRFEISGIWIIRALIRFYLNLYSVKRMQAEMPQEAAISKLSPPIFFKLLGDFKMTLNSLELKDITNSLHSFFIVEKMMKSNGYREEQLLEIVFFNRQLSSYFK